MCQNTTPKCCSPTVPAVLAYAGACKSCIHSCIRPDTGHPCLDDAASPGGKAAMHTSYVGPFFTAQAAVAEALTPGKAKKEKSTCSVCPGPSVPSMGRMSNSWLGRGLVALELACNALSVAWASEPADEYSITTVHHTYHQACCVFGLLSGLGSPHHAARVSFCISQAFGTVWMLAEAITRSLLPLPASSSDACVTQLQL